MKDLDQKIDFVCGGMFKEGSETKTFIEVIKNLLHLSYDYNGDNESRALYAIKDGLIDEIDIKEVQIHYEHIPKEGLVNCMWKDDLALDLKTMLNVIDAL